jgi:hypothetical protein
MELWQFLQDGGNWSWRQIDAFNQVTGESRMEFASRRECIADAMRHGYLGRPIGKTRGHERPGDALGDYLLKRR